MSEPLQITVAAPINIAFIKYWGKRDGGEALILPTNDSFSITLSTEPFRSKTSVVLSDKVEEDELWLNGEKVDVQKSARLVNVLRTIRETSPADRAKLKAFMVSDNNFPTAAGMASSASGYCALACALVEVFGSTADTSVLARIGSGSACRSVYGGFVKWFKGTKDDGTDCVARQFVDHTHWPEMNVLCAVVKAQQKDVSSTLGMQLSVKTSPMMKDRIASIVDERMTAVSEAVKQKDFATFGAIAMTDSDDLQMICKTTEPIIQYATQDSYDLIKLVKAYNAWKGRIAWSYTFDAGANAFMFTLNDTLAEVVAVLLAHFPTEDNLMAFNSKTLLSEAKAAATQLPDELKNGQLLGADWVKKPLSYLLQSPVGSGPCKLPNEESLIDVTTLQRKKQ